MVQMKNRVSGLLTETGVEYNKQRLHKVSYFRELLSANGEVPPSLRPLLKLSRETIEHCQKTEYALVSSLQRDPVLADRIKRLRTVPGVGPITALTWALAIGDVSRFGTIKQAISYCGLCRNKQDQQNAQTARSCMLPTERGDHPPEALYELFRDWQRTHSIFCDGSSEPETVNGCLVLPSAGTDAERHTVARRTS
jgi:hypothetical protein